MSNTRLTDWKTPVAEEKSEAKHHQMNPRGQDWKSPSCRACFITLKKIKRKFLKSYHAIQRFYNHPQSEINQFYTKDLE